MFIDSMENPADSVKGKIDKRFEEMVKKNRHIVGCVADAVLYCAKQCIALRGDHESIEEQCGNPGNFLALIKLMSSYDEQLAQHLKQPDDPRATYLSPQIQNEMIEVISGLVMENLLDEIKDARFYSIMADEVTSHSQEQLALCFRFVDSQSNIREEFLAFIKLSVITGKAIAKAIIDWIKENGLVIENCRGQCYDGASNMSSENVGVQARIKQLSPRAPYCHCNSHKLSLCICGACGIPEIRDVVSTLSKVH